MGRRHRTTAARLLVTLGVLAAGACGGGSDSGDGAGDAPDHGSHSHGDSAGGAAGTSAERCDAGANTAEFNATTTLADDPHTHHDGDPVDFTLREWAEVFVDDEVSGVTVDQVMSYYEDDPRRGEQILQGESTPHLGPDQWAPTTDATACTDLIAQLQAARDGAARYPTLADAQAAGYTPGSFYAPGGGAHYVNTGFMADGFDPANPELLMFDGHEPDSHVVGVMYYLHLPDGLPDEDVGFTGANDHWHSHATACRIADGLTVPRTECDAGRGTVSDSSAGWMAHAWVVPGCESDWGVFSEANPRLPILSGRDPQLSSASARGEPSTFDVGCNSGTTIDDPLGFDDADDDPAVA